MTQQPAKARLRRSAAGAFIAAGLIVPTASPLFAAAPSAELRPAVKTYPVTFSYSYKTEGKDGKALRKTGQAKDVSLSLWDVEGDYVSDTESLAPGLYSYRLTAKGFAPSTGYIKVKAQGSKAKPQQIKLELRQAESQPRLEKKLSRKIYGSLDQDFSLSEVRFPEKDEKVQELSLGGDLPEGLRTWSLYQQDEKQAEEPREGGILLRLSGRPKEAGTFALELYSRTADKESLERWELEVYDRSRLEKAYRQAEKLQKQKNYKELENREREDLDGLMAEAYRLRYELKPGARELSQKACDAAASKLEERLSRLEAKLKPASIETSSQATTAPSSTPTPTAPSTTPTPTASSTTPTPTAPSSTPTTTAPSSTPTTAAPSSTPTTAATSSSPAVQKRALRDLYNYAQRLSKSARYANFSRSQKLSLDTALRIAAHNLNSDKASQREVDEAYRYLKEQLDILDGRSLPRTGERSFSLLLPLSFSAALAAFIWRLQRRKRLSEED